MLDIVTVGHIAIDSVFLPGRDAPYVIMGGSAAYVSFTVTRLDATAAVMSKVGSDFPKAYVWWLRQEGVDLSNLVKVDDELTTRFELMYSHDLSNRILTSKNQMSPIRLSDLTSLPNARAIHLGPIAGEVTCELAERLRDHCRIMSLDPQGSIRSFSEDGTVSAAQPADTRMLKMVDIFKSSHDELEAVTGIKELEPALKAIHDFGVKIAIVTMGKKGSVVSVENTINNVPACSPVKFADPTGAGDAFIGGFLAEYVRGEDCSWCSCVGSAAASLVVEGPGPTIFGGKDEMYRRASLLYEKGIKQ